MITEKRNKLFLSFVSQVQASCEQAMRLCHRTMSFAFIKHGLVCNRCKVRAAALEGFLYDH